MKRTRKKRSIVMALVAVNLLFILPVAGAIASATIGSSEIRNNSVQSKDIKNSTLTTYDLASNAVYASDINAGAVAT